MLLSLSSMKLKEGLKAKETNADGANGILRNTTIAVSLK